MVLEVALDVSAEYWHSGVLERLSERVFLSLLQKAKTCR